MLLKPNDRAVPHLTLLKAIADYEARAEQAYADIDETRYPAGEYLDYLVGAGQCLRG